MRIVPVKDYRIVTNHTFPKEELAVGQRWVTADGSELFYTIEALLLESEYVRFSFQFGDQRMTGEQDYFTFQANKRLVVE